MSMTRTASVPKTLPGPVEIPVRLSPFHATTPESLADSAVDLAPAARLSWA